MDKDEGCSTTRWSSAEGDGADDAAAAAAAAAENAGAALPAAAAAAAAPPTTRAAPQPGIGYEDPCSPPLGVPDAPLWLHGEDTKQKPAVALLQPLALGTFLVRLKKASKGLVYSLAVNVGKAKPDKVGLGVLCVVSPHCGAEMLMLAP